MCIGGMIVARTVVDRTLADDLRSSCMSAAHELAGWKRNSRKSAAKSKKASHFRTD
jgi:hypothetical protein